MSKKENDAPAKELEPKTPATEETPADSAAETEGQEAMEVEGARETVAEVLLKAVKLPRGVKGLNLRQGPGLQYPVLSVLEEGSVAGELELPLGVEVSGWALVFISSDLIGWVDRRYIKDVEG